MWIVRHAHKIKDVADRLISLTNVSQMPILSPQHGEEGEILRRAASRAQSFRNAFALTAGSGSPDDGRLELARVLKDLQKLSEWASATSCIYSRAPEYMRTQFPGRRRQGDHRSVDRLALEAFVFDALRTFQQVAGKPGIAKADAAEGNAMPTI